MSPVSIPNDGITVELPASTYEPQPANGKIKGHNHKSAVLNRSLHHDPVRVISAKGNYLYLNNGQKIFDATGGAAVACLGHGDERYAIFT